MRVLLCVLEDLWLFATHAVYGLLISKRGEVLQLHAPEYASQRVVSRYATTFDHTSTSARAGVGTTYFIGEADVNVYVNPVEAFDTIFHTLQYGDMVSVRSFSGRWACIMTLHGEGWILKDVLEEQAKDVQPTFAIGVEYGPHNPHTQTLRKTIKDAFGGGACALPLQDIEYVTYMLQRKGRMIPWGVERPRIAGTWQRYLRGKRGIHISITPKTDCVMEYITSEGIGHIGYVVSVFPDETILISSIGTNADGMYDEEMVHKEVYKELRPVFIEIQ